MRRKVPKLITRPPVAMVLVPERHRFGRRPFWLIVVAIMAVGLSLGAVGWSRLRPAPVPTDSHLGMRWIPGGEFAMGTDSDLGWPDEQPPHPVHVDGFWIDEHEVTNASFHRFVAATGYITTAERPVDVAAIMAQVPPGTPPPPPENLLPGSLVFQPTGQPVQLDDVSAWWHWTPGASWRHPEGPGSEVVGRDDHPVVHVSWDDGVAYTRWAGKRLPSEAEWERAARGGLDGATYTWGDDSPGESGRWQANLWQGRFPVRNTATDGFPRTSPVGSFAPNGYGLFDMAGNVWEWCSDWYERGFYSRLPSRTATVNPTGPGRSDDPTQPWTPLRVQRGGSFLCNDAYCSRYRPSARHGASPDTGMSHVGFRCAMSAAQ